MTDEDRAAAAVLIHEELRASFAALTVAVSEFLTSLIKLRTQLESRQLQDTEEKA